MEPFVELTILSHLVFNETYTRKVIPHLRDDFFHKPAERLAFVLVKEYVDKYNGLPTRESLLIDLQKREGVTEDVYRDAKAVIENLRSENTDLEWLIDTTEKFCQSKAIYNAVLESIQILDDKTGKKSQSSIPDLLSDALAISFDNHVGHDYLDDAMDRYEQYHRKVEKVPFDIDLLNKVTGGGIERQTLTCILGGVGVGKTMCMCHQAAHNLASGKNVLYITNEMADWKIAQRIDANLLGVSLGELGTLSKDMFEERIQRVKDRTVGKLIIRQFPTATAHVGHFKALVKELRLKRNFKPDIIYIDYINICTSMRVKAGAGINSYTLIKSIAEEIRGLAVELNLPVVTATQLTRAGYSSSDPEMDDTAESFGLPATVDFMYAIVATEELARLGQMMIKQLKNRFGDENYYRRFVVGVDKSRMRLFNLDEAVQRSLADAGQQDDKPVKSDKPTFDQTAAGLRMAMDQSTKDRLNRLLKK